MAKNRAQTLKVFQAQFGFHDAVVAAPSQAAALRAWGTRQNLFADGEARVTSDERAVAAALANPGVVLRRAVGSQDPFSLDPGLPSLPDLPRSKFEPKPRSKPKSKPKPARATPRPPPPDRRALDAAEARLAAVHEGTEREMADLAARRAALDAEEKASKERWRVARLEADRLVQRERKAYVASGGTLPPG